MIVDFNSIPAEAKLWIFPSSRKFYPQEIPELQKKIEAFLTTWSSNQEKPLSCASIIKYDRFVIIVADDTETPLSLEVHNLLSLFILGLEKTYDIVLLDKINVCYKQGDFVQYKDLIAFKKMIKAKGVSTKTVVFNNLIDRKEDLDYNWEINIMDSWLGRFLQKQ